MTTKVLAGIKAAIDQTIGWQAFLGIVAGVAGVAVTVCLNYLLRPPPPDSAPPTNNFVIVESLIEKLIAEGDVQFRNRRYSAAASLYSEAVSLAKKSVSLEDGLKVQDPETRDRLFKRINVLEMRVETARLGEELGLLRTAKMSSAGAASTPSSLAN